MGNTQRAQDECQQAQARGAYDESERVLFLAVKPNGKRAQQHPA
jgi:hypothetical protein